jgi:hypothetical protein
MAKDPDRPNMERKSTMRYLKSSLLVAVLAITVLACNDSGGSTDGTAPADALGTTAPLGSPVAVDDASPAGPASTLPAASVAPAE